jgi:hypothetical protein
MKYEHSNDSSTCIFLNLVEERNIVSEKGGNAPEHHSALSLHLPIVHNALSFFHPFTIV